MHISPDLVHSARAILADVIRQEGGTHSAAMHDFMCDVLDQPPGTKLGIRWADHTWHGDPTVRSADALLIRLVAAMERNSAKSLTSVLSQTRLRINFATLPNLAARVSVQAQAVILQMADQSQLDGEWDCLDVMTRDNDVRIVLGLPGTALIDNQHTTLMIHERVYAVYVAADGRVVSYDEAA